jgi:hypothetical protein
MRTRLFSACVLSAWLASLAPAQGPGNAPPSNAPVTSPSQADGLPYPNTPPQTPVFQTPWAGQDASPAGTVQLPLRTTAAQAQPRGPGILWVDNDFLMWWIQGTRLPPLVSTSPAGTPAATAGNLGAISNTSIYGPGSQDNNLRLGWRLTVGSWIDDEHRFAVEANFLMIANGGNQFSAQSSGDPMLARPIINGNIIVTGAEPIAVPGVSSGSIHISSVTTGVVGGGIWLRENFTRSDDPCDTCHPCRRGAGCCGGADPNSSCYWRFDSLFGYRTLRFADRLYIDDVVNAVAPLNGVPAGSTLERSDRIRAMNTFHGLDLGTTGDVMWGPWTVNAVAKVAIGFNDSSVDIFGIHTVDGVFGSGGLFAQPTNIGHHTRNQVSAVPEIGLKLGYNIAPNMKISAGYNFLYWYHVVRAANEVNRNIDQTFLTSGAPTAFTPVQPGFSFQDRSLWVQGVSVGLEWRY